MTNPFLDGIQEKEIVADKDFFLNFKRTLEKQLLATILNNPSWMGTFLGYGITVDDFGDFDHKELFKVLKYMTENNKRLIFTEISTEFALRTKRTLLVEDWSCEFNDLSKYIPLTSDEYRQDENKIFDRMLSRLASRAEFDDYCISLVGLEGHVQLLKTMNKRLRIAKEASVLTKRAYAMEPDLPYEKLEQEAVTLHERIGSIAMEEDVSCSEAFAEIEKDLFSKQANSFSTGFKTLDAMVQMTEDSSVVVIGARPGVGKTSFALQVMFHKMQSLGENDIILYFSAEAGKKELLKRLLQIKTGARVGNQLSFADATVMKEKIRSFEKANREAFEKVKIYETSITLENIKTICKRWSYSHAIKLVIVDYLQLVEDSGKNQIREQVVANISRSLKILAKDVQTHVLLLSQLNRAVEARETKKPTLADLRESGSIEQDANVVMLLSRDEKKPDTRDVIVAKNRYGGMGEAVFMWDQAKFCFQEGR